MRIAIGTNEALPLGVNCSTPRARGPVSFFFAGRRSPGMICGRSSCALAVRGIAATQLNSATSATPEKTLRCKILKNISHPGFIAPALRFVLSGEIPMNINDKAPDFTLQDENGKEVALEDLRGKTVVLFFYPRANTPG